MRKLWQVFIILVILLLLVIELIPSLAQDIIAELLSSRLMNLAPNKFRLNLKETEYVS